MVTRKLIFVVYNKIYSWRDESCQTKKNFEFSFYDNGEISKIKSISFVFHSMKKINVQNLEARQNAKTTYQRKQYLTR